MYGNILVIALIVFAIERFLHNRRIKKYDKEELKRRRELDTESLMLELGNISKRDYPSSFNNELKESNFKNLYKIAGTIKEEKVKQNALKAIEILKKRADQGVFSDTVISEATQAVSILSKKDIK